MIVAGLACFMAGFLVATFGSSIVKSRSFSKQLRAGPGNYQFINPLLACQENENEQFKEFTDLQSEIKNITKSAQDKKTIISGSVYFRDLTEGQWTGVNQNDLYVPASLLKVPILIAYLKASETDPELPKKTAYYEQKPGEAPPLVDNFVLSSGNFYTVEDLLRGMIIDSDNTARDMLEGGMNKAFLNEVYSELGIPSPYSDPSLYQISTRTYALFFRVLYNATFLNHDMSEKALTMLSRVVFDKGLRAGIPSDIPIAHKYGFKILKQDEPRIIELSDCGIVYDPNKPYLLCVMARGNDPDVTATYIRDVAYATNRLIKTQ